MALNVQGTFAPELSAFDSLVRDFVNTSGGAPAMSLAVARNGRLVFQESVSRDDAGDPMVLQTSPARFASCGKLITKIAIYQLIENGALGPDGQPVTFNSLASKLLPNLPSPTISWPVVSTAWSNVTILQLLLMSSAMSTNLWVDVEVAKTFGTKLPVYNKLQFIRYVIGVADGVPDYSNTSYLVLSAIVEALSGLDYVDYVKQNIFAPLGLVRPRPMGLLQADRAPYEVNYHPADPGPYKSITDPSQPMVVHGMGNFNLKVGIGAGGWLMCAADFAKIMSAFAVASPGPLFKTKAFVDQMFATGTQQWANVKYGPTTSYEWGGVLPGLRAYASYRPDGVVITLFFNSDATTALNAWNPTLLNKLHATADSITNWPGSGYDLFESVAIPTFTKGPNWGAAGGAKAEPGSGWKGWYPLGGRLLGGPAATVVTAGYYDIFGIGWGGRLWQKWWDGTKWQPGANDWSLHDDGSQRFQGTPAAASLSTSLRDLYLVAADGSVTQKFWNGAWNGPYNLGGIVGGEPHVALLAINNLRDLYVRGTNGHLYHKFWTPSTGWQPSNLGWTEHKESFDLTSAPAVVGDAAMRDVYAVGADGAVWHKVWKAGGNWGKWISIGAPPGGAVKGKPAVVMVHPGFIDVYVRGADDRLYQKWWDGTQWTPSATGWVLHDDGAFRLASAPSVISESDHHRGVFVTGKDGCMYYKFWLK